MNILSLCLQNTTVEALLILKEHSFLVFTEDDGRGAAEGALGGVWAEFLH